MLLLMLRPFVSVRLLLKVLIVSHFLVINVGIIRLLVKTINRLLGQLSLSCIARLSRWEALWSLLLLCLCRLRHIAQFIKKNLLLF